MRVDTVVQSYVAIILVLVTKAHNPKEVRFLTELFLNFLSSASEITHQVPSKSCNCSKLTRNKYRLLLLKLKQDKRGRAFRVDFAL